MVLTKFDYDPLLDLAPWVGQRQATFRFDWFNGVTGEQYGQIHPLRSATLTHDTARTIKRRLTLPLGAVDTAAINAVQDRIAPYMVFPNGAEYPLGVYMFTDTSRQVFTAGKLGSYVLTDEMFRVDQPLEVGYSNGLANPTLSSSEVITRVLEGIPLQLDIEPSSFTSIDSWGVGTSRGSILEKLAVSGDYFSPWFDNNGVMRLIRAFDPADQIPDFDLDSSNIVFRSSIMEADNLLTAPNRFIVISNDSDDTSVPVYGTYDIPETLPHSVLNRGFAIPDVREMSVQTNTQAAAIARNIGIQETVFEEVALSTAPDPRYDSYNVVHWQGVQWLELAWSMALTEGGAMNHRLRRAYSG